VNSRVENHEPGISGTGSVQKYLLASDGFSFFLCTALNVISETDSRIRLKIIY
jgi:hypothetical protein